MSQSTPVNQRKRLEKMAPRPSLNIHAKKEVCHPSRIFMTAVRRRWLALAGLIFLSLPLALTAAPRDDILAGYATAAKQADPGFSGFSAARGEAFYGQRFAGGKADTPSCRTCHGGDPRQRGRTLTGKDIEPMAVSSSPSRYSDPAKVEKWFKRNCNEVLGRECSVREKGDWLSWLFQR